MKLTSEPTLLTFTSEDQVKWPICIHNDTKTCKANRTTAAKQRWLTRKDWTINLPTNIPLVLTVTEPSVHWQPKDDWSGLRRLEGWIIGKHRLHRLMLLLFFFVIGIDTRPAAYMTFQSLYNLPSGRSIWSFVRPSKKNTGSSYIWKGMVCRSVPHTFPKLVTGYTSFTE